MIKITIVSTKGGVGKTTLTANLGAILADSGYRVLLLDMDPQPTLSSYYRLKQKASGGLTELLINPVDQNVISQTEIDDVDIVLSNDPQGKLRDWIRDAPDGRVRLKHLLAKYETRYDFVLIDTQGAIGPLQDAAVVAADFMVSPIPPEILSAHEFVRGTISMIERLKPMARLGAPIGSLKGVIYRQDRTIDARLIVKELRKGSFTASKGVITICDTVIPNSVVYREAATRRIPVHRHERQRRKGSSAYSVMMALAGELVPNLPQLDAIVND